jgi:hypothetical protein
MKVVNEDSSDSREFYDVMVQGEELCVKVKMLVSVRPQHYSTGKIAVWKIP